MSTKAEMILPLFLAAAFIAFIAFIACLWSYCPEDDEATRTAQMNAYAAEAERCQKKEEVYLRLMKQQMIPSPRVGFANPKSFPVAWH